MPLLDQRVCVCYTQSALTELTEIELRVFKEDTMSVSDNDIQGRIVLPKQAPLWGTLVFVVALAGQLWVGASWVSDVRNESVVTRSQITDLRRYMDDRLVGVAESDKRILDRSDERYAQVRARLEILERDRERLLRMDGKLDYVLDAIKDLRSTIGEKRANRVSAETGR